MLPRLGIRAATAYVGLILLGAFLPVSVSVAIGVLVGSVSPAIGNGLGSPAGTHLLTVLAVTGALYVVRQMHGPIQEAIGGVLGERLQSEGASLVMRACSSPAGIAHLEDSTIADKIRLSDEIGTANSARAAVPALAIITSSRLSAIAFGIILLHFRWWAPLVMIAAWSGVSYYGHQTAVLFLKRAEAATQGLRRSDYMRELVIAGGAAKELRVFGLGGWLLDRFSTYWYGGMDDIWRERLRLWRIILPAYGGLGLSYALLLTAAGQAAAHHTIGIGALVIYLQAASGMGGLYPPGDSGWELKIGARPIGHALEMRQAVTTPATDLHGSRAPEHDAPARSIRIESLHFTYPGRDSAVFDGLDLEIPAGRSLAVVGENGAGKTTLIKMLCRFYDPAAGRITIDGVDLREFDPGAWRSQIGVIFQDFVRYELSARDNVGLGAPFTDDEEALRHAARLAGADGIVERLPEGWNTTLSRKYAGGAELSGGEWQRIALARALYAVRAGARVLVLDEPTANLDVRAEAELYERFLEITHGVTTILISHRFSTVRKADHICVIEHGKLLEQGTHDELLEREGTYARMFNLQASAYLEEIADA
ncbi:MAG: ABC transporter ATP-binding protein [Actinomycetota bacterium]